MKSHSDFRPTSHLISGTLPHLSAIIQIPKGSQRAYNICGRRFQLKAGHRDPLHHVNQHILSTGWAMECNHNILQISTLPTAMSTQRCRRSLTLLSNVHVTLQICSFKRGLDLGINIKFGQFVHNELIGGNPPQTYWGGAYWEQYFLLKKTMSRTPKVQHHCRSDEATYG